jgi:topoisomerase-4 subunit A
VREEKTLNIITSNRQHHTISSEKLKIEERKSFGKSLVPLEKGEQIVEILVQRG